MEAIQINNRLGEGEDDRIMNRASGNWDNIKTSNICVFAGFPGRQKRFACAGKKAFDEQWLYTSQICRKT